MPIHDRVPVTLEPADWPVWLGEEPGAPAALLHPAADGLLEMWPIGRAVNSPRNNWPELLEPVGLGPATLPDLHSGLPDEC
jgi:putative SOS response-associated peptidase YedK